MSLEMKMVSVYGNKLFRMEYHEDVWKRVVPERWYSCTNEYDVICEKRRILISTSMRTGKLEY